MTTSDRSARPQIPARRLLHLAGVLLMSAPASPLSAAHHLMPAPAQLQSADGRLAIERGFSVAVQGPADPRLHRALGRTLRAWEERLGFAFPRTPAGEFELSPGPARATLVIDCAAAAPELPALETDESYTLDVTPTQAVLRAPNTIGALRGLATLQQLLQLDAPGAFLPALAIRDRPRFPWRGLMIDVCRHWQPLDVIKRNLDGMALVKLNVLHLHLSEDQGFRVESRTHPELQERGSDGHFFTQDELRDLIAFAADRGIRVVPEFDLPGHATSWVVSHPELASAPGPYAIERRWGVFDPVLDPANEATYALLADVLGEMATLFPDPYFHIGGDENNGVQWNANPRLQAFIREHDLKDNAGLHAWFNQRLHAILALHGKRIVGWDEILHPDLSKDSVVHSWRGAAGLADAARRGYATILSNGYYIDLCYSAAQHYSNDPLPADTPLTPAEQARVLGGEATMWAEWVTPETIDSRIWPRTAAIAERLWSPREVNDVPDMYRRLAVVSRRLEEAGLNHERNRPAMIRRLAGDAVSEDTLALLAAFIDLIEPVKGYQRGTYHDFTQATPLGTLADCARPESDVARRFAEQVAQFLATDPAHRAEPQALLEQQLTGWLDVGSEVRAWLETRPPAQRGAAPVAAALTEACAIGLDAIEALGHRKPRDQAWRAAQLAALDRAAAPQDAIELPVIASIRQLVNAASEPPRS